MHSENFITLCLLKRVASILLLGILLFNWFGYQLLTCLLEQRANQQVDNLIDKNFYQESELISIKVPADHLGYFINTSQFERVNGKVEIAGIQYNYVKRRLYNDTLELFCIRNAQATAVKSARNEICKWINDASSPSKKSSPTPWPVKNLTTDYYTEANIIKLFNPESCLLHESRDESHGILLPHLIKIDQPPEIKA